MAPKDAEEVRAPPGLHEDDYAHSSAEPSEASECEENLESLLGIRITTSFGPGILEEINESEDLIYFSVRLDTFGTVSLAQGTVEALLRRGGNFEQGISHLRPKAAGPKLAQLTGYIRMYNPAKGWGFIVCDEFEGDVFLHSKHMVGNLPREYIGHFQSSRDGHKVTFQLDKEGGKKPQALNVSVVSLNPQLEPVYAKKDRGARTGAAGGRDGDFDDHLDRLEEENQLDEPFYDDDMADAELAAGAADAGYAHDGGDPPWAHCVSLADSLDERPTERQQLDERPGERDQHFWLSANLSANLSSLHLGDSAKHKGVLRMRGLPFTATAHDISVFFEGYGVRIEDVTLGQRLDGSPSGEACVLFARDELAEKARKERHMQHMGHRYIELFNTKDSLEDQGVSFQDGLQQPAKAVGPVIAGAAPPAVGPCAASAAMATFAAAMHASQGGQPSTGYSAQAHAMGGMQPPQSPPEGADQASQQYMQFFQQAYASAMQSQAAQAYAQSAAVHYQQHQMPPPTAPLMAPPVATAHESSRPPAFEFKEEPEVAAAAADAIATPTTTTGAASAAEQSFVAAIAGEAGLDYAMATTSVEEAYEAQPRWQYYNVI